MNEGVKIKRGWGKEERVWRREKSEENIGVGRELEFGERKV